MTPRELLVGTWNLGHAVRRDETRRRAAWEYLAQMLNGGIGLVQEAGGFASTCSLVSLRSLVWMATPGWRRGTTE
ncbi:MAG: hypothetical protein ACRDKW_14260 [Actinomycetota bacterium]